MGSAEPPWVASNNVHEDVHILKQQGFMSRHDRVSCILFPSWSVLKDFMYGRERTGQLHQPGARFGISGHGITCIRPHTTGWQSPFCWHQWQRVHMRNVAATGPRSHLAHFHGCPSLHPRPSQERQLSSSKGWSGMESWGGCVHAHLRIIITEL